MPDFEDKIPLSEFSVTNNLHATDRVPLIQASGEDWDNFCAALLDMALWIVKDAEYTSAGLNTQSKKIIGAIDEVAGKWLSSTLSAGSTSIVFTDDSILSTSIIEVFADNGNLYFTSIVVDGANHTCTIGFPSQSSAVDVDIWVR